MATMLKLSIKLKVTKNGDGAKFWENIQHS